MDRKLCQDIGELVDKVGEARVIRELGVHRTTVMRWRHGKVQIPASALRHLRQLVHTVPDPEWYGWYFEQGRLVCPEGWAFRPGEVIAGRFDKAVIASLKERVATLEAELAAVRDFSANDPRSKFISSAEIPLQHGVESGRGDYDSMLAVPVTSRRQAKCGR